MLQIDHEEVPVTQFHNTGITVESVRRAASRGTRGGHVLRGQGKSPANETACLLP